MTFFTPDSGFVTIAFSPSILMEAVSELFHSIAVPKTSVGSVKLDVTFSALSPSASFTETKSSGVYSLLSSIIPSIGYLPSTTDHSSEVNSIPPSSRERVDFVLPLKLLSIE